MRALFVLFLSAVGAAGALCGCEQSPPEPVLRVAFWDLTKERPLPDDAEIWLLGQGRWWIARMDGAGYVLVKVPFDVVHERGMLIYADARQRSQEIVVPFKVTADMRPKTPGGGITVIIRDEEIEVLGKPIEAASGQAERRFPRAATGRGPSPRTG